MNSITIFLQERIGKTPRASGKPTASPWQDDRFSGKHHFWPRFGLGKTTIPLASPGPKYPLYNIN